MMFAKKLRSLTNKSNTIVHLRMSQNMVRGTNPDDCTIFILIPAFFSRAPLSALEASFLRVFFFSVGGVTSKKCRLMLDAQTCRPR